MIFIPVKQENFYAEYLKSEAWRAKREDAFRHYGRKCDRCGSTRNLHIHHLSYARLGREEMEDLQVLCHDCHEKRHDRTFLRDGINQSRKKEKLCKRERKQVEQKNHLRTFVKLYQPWVKDDRKRAIAMGFLLGEKGEILNPDSPIQRQQIAPPKNVEKALEDFLTKTWTNCDAKIAYWVKKKGFCPKKWARRYVERAMRAIRRENETRVQRGLSPLPVERYGQKTQEEFVAPF